MNFIFYLPDYPLSPAKQHGRPFGKVRASCHGCGIPAKKTVGKLPAIKK